MNDINDFIEQYEQTENTDYMELDYITDYKNNYDDDDSLDNGE